MSFPNNDRHISNADPPRPKPPRRDQEWAAELAAALTFAHRILNRLASEATEAQPAKRSLLDTIREEPSAVNFEIKSASNGSVVIAGIMAIAGDPFAQGIAGGIVSNVLTPKILAAAEKTKGLFRRPAS